MHIGILCAMPEEIGSAIEHLKNIEENDFGDLKIFSGEWLNNNLDNSSIYLSVAWSGWGKVSAARAATRILSTNYKGKSLDLLIFTGVAGAVDSRLKQWDIVLPTELIQHDMDARPLFQKYVIPSLNSSEIKSLDQWLNWAFKTLIEQKLNIKPYPFGSIKKGKIATGDTFISDKSFLETLSIDLKGLMAVEMEGAAVAQVATQEQKPWLIIRVISDGADEYAAQNFTDFLKNYEKCSWSLIEILLKNIDKSPLGQRY